MPFLTRTHTHELLWERAFHKCILLIVLFGVHRACLGCCWTINGRTPPSHLLLWTSSPVFLQREWQNITKRLSRTTCSPCISTASNALHQIVLQLGHLKRGVGSFYSVSLLLVLENVWMQSEFDWSKFILFKTTNVFRSLYNLPV